MASRFGNKLPYWKDGGLKHYKRDSIFKKIEADMHNLVPAVAEINGDLSKYQFGAIPSEQISYGSCNFEINFKERLAEQDHQ